MYNTKYNTTFMHYGSKIESDKICNLIIIADKILGKCQIEDNNYLVFFKIKTEIMTNLENKLNKTLDDKLLCSSTESLFKTKSEFVTESTNISKILTISGSPFSLKISSKNNKIKLISSSYLPKMLHYSILKDIIIEKGIEFNDNSYSVVDYQENIMNLKKKT
jgi:hypothetical protein